MDSQFEHVEENNQPKDSPSFCKRFNIEVGLEAAKVNFINRIINLIEIKLPELEARYMERRRASDTILQLVATGLGVRYDSSETFSGYVGNDFNQLLHAVEELYKAIREVSPEAEQIIEELVVKAIQDSEVDLGLRWRNGSFYKSGAKLLDEALVSENLGWLSERGYIDVVTPFEKGLRHLLEAQRQPEKLADTITDIYEALEALAKVVTGRERDLSGNRELFISKLGLSEYYGGMLGNHIEYANLYRHAPQKDEKRKSPLPNEVEAFVYTTGLFIRLAIQQLNK